MLTKCTPYNIRSTVAPKVPIVHRAGKGRAEIGAPGVCLYLYLYTAFFIFTFIHFSILLI